MDDDDKVNASANADANDCKCSEVRLDVAPRTNPTVFLGPNGDYFIAFDPLGHLGAAEATMGCPGALQVEKLRPLGSPIAAAAKTQNTKQGELQ
jgi:hypothetical protein